MRIGLIGLLALALAGCSDDSAAPSGDVGPEAVGPEVGVGPEAFDPNDTSPPPDYEPVVFAVITDIHIEGGIDHGVSQNVAGLIADAAARDPAPEFIAITGDLIDAFEEPVDTGPGSKMDALRTLFTEAPVPVEVALGNHDYYTTGEALMAMTSDPEARTALFQEELGIEPWYFTEHGATRFVYLNAMADPRVEASLGLNGAMGAEQLQWLDDVLSEGVASVLFLHHPPSIVLEDGEVALGSVIRDHADTVLAIFVGHIHVWGRDSFEGVPVFLTNAGYDGDSLHHVRVDAAAGTVEILNVDEIDYGETEKIPCDPERAPVLTDTAALEGTPLVLLAPDAHIQPMGLGTYLREIVGEVPMVLRLGASDGAQTEVAALFTIGARVGDSADGAPAYVKPVTGGSCAVTFLSLDGPCFSTAPVTLEIDVGKVAGFPLPPGWRLRAAMKDLVLSGVLTDAGMVEQGVLETTLDFEPGARDVEAIIIQEYCNGSLDGCVPGEVDMPSCPDDPGPEFYAEIPVECDVSLLGFGLRFLFDIFESIPDLTVSLDANFQVWPAEVLGDPAPGGVAPDLFALAPEGACPTD